jgi:ADP-heptose:LPS heptosyltransferase
VLERCSKHVGGDSGVLHLAAALDRPTLSIFREYVAFTEWLPRGRQHRHLAARCACLDQVRESCQRRQTAECLEGLSPASVASLLLAPAT